MSVPGLRSARSRLMRWTVLRIGGIALVLASAVSAVVLWFGGRSPAPLHIDLYLDGIAVDHRGDLVSIPAHQPAQLLPGSLVLDPGPQATPAERFAAEALADEHRSWLDAAPVPAQGTS